MGGGAWRSRRFDGTVLVQPPNPYCGWTMSVIRQRKPIISAMARGRAYSESVRANISATFDASMSHARSVRSGIDRSTSGFVHYLNDRAVVENGGGGHVDAGFAQSGV
jgi:hypothetical protein